MNHIFDDKKFKKLESPERLKIMPPDLIISHLNIKSGDVIADVGCGIGYFAFPFADVVGESGSIKAADISDIMIEELTKRVKSRNYKNIQVIKSSNTDIGIDKSSVNLFFTSTLTHELEDLEGFTATAINTLKEDGRIAYFDFEKKDTGFGPSLEKRVSSESVIDLFKSKGLTDVIKYEVNNAFYLIIAKKK